jgi:ParB family chromosome partitioning protein
MTKLKAPQTAGWNAGKNYYAKMMRIEDIKIDPEIARVFKMSDEIREAVKEDIQEHGYDTSQPLGLWKGRDIVLDGHTRLAAAKEAGLEEVPIVELEFEDKGDAILYTFERQVIRRNLTAAEIMRAVELMPETRSRKGQGRTAAQLAQRLKVSEAHIYQARAILKKGTQEDIEAVKAGTLPVKRAYLKVNPPKEPGEDTIAEQAGKRTVELAGFTSVNLLDILKSAVVLLSEAKEAKAALLLIHHFFRKHERESFMNILPQEARKLLADILPV